jgi:hypothetical protein
MNLYKLGIKIFFARPPADERDFIPVFHRWIQEQKISAHQLIDVHDYAHVHNGPGILLVAHEGNFSVDSTGGRLGLVYYRKQPLDGDVAGRLAAMLQTLLGAVSLIEVDPALKGCAFKRDELIAFSNDRLLAPNTTEARAALEPSVTAFAAKAFKGANVRLGIQSTDPRERLGFNIQSSGKL